MLGIPLSLFTAATTLASLFLTSGDIFAGTTPPVFTIVDRAPWAVGDAIEGARGFSDGRGHHWVSGAISGANTNPRWRLRSYDQDQPSGTDRYAYASFPIPEPTKVFSVAFKEHLVGAVGAASSGTGSRGIARISYDGGVTWNDLNEFSCGAGQLTQFTSVGFYDAATVFVAGFCVDLTGATRWFVRRGIFDESEMQWFWANSDQLVGRPGVNNIASQILVAPNGEVLVFGRVQNETSSAIAVRSSTDKGRTWRTISTPAISTETLAVLKATPSRDGRLLLMTGAGATESRLGRVSILASSDNGRTWSAVNEWSLSDGFFGATGDLLALGNEMIAVGSAVSALGASTGWLRRSTDGGGTWTQFDSAGEFSAGSEFVGLHQVGSSPVLVSGLDRMVTGEHRITYRAFRPPRN